MTWCGLVGRRGGRFTTVPPLVWLAGAGVWVVAWRRASTATTSGLIAPTDSAEVMPAITASDGRDRWSRSTSINAWVPATSPLVLRAAAQNASWAAVNAPAARACARAVEERAGLVPQHFEVMVQLDPGHATGAEARAGGEDGAALEHDHARGPQGHADALADEVRGDGVLDHADGDQGGAVDAGVEDQAGVEVVGRQRCQVGQLGVVVLPDRVGVAGDAAGVVVVLPGADLVVEFVQGGDSGHGGEVFAAEPSDLALDAAFLVGAVDAGLAVERVEAVVGAEQHSAFVLVA